MPDDAPTRTTRRAPDRAVRPFGGLAVGVLAAGVVAALLAAPHAGAAAGPPPTSPVPAAGLATPQVDELAAALVPVAAVAPPETTTSTAPPPPPPPPPVTVAPVAVVAPAAVDLQARVEAALVDAVPVSWRESLPTTLRVIRGATSYATGPGLIEIGEGPASGSWSHLLSVVAHEFGHLIAFRDGTRAYVGAAPAGWPDPGFAHPAEAWADCVAQAFTGVVDPSYDLPPCPPASLDWTARWLAGER